MQSTMSLLLSAVLFASSGLGMSPKHSKQFSSRDGLNTTSFAVTNFSANCIPHSTYCSYSFNITTAPNQHMQNTTAATTACAAFLPGPDYLPSVPLTGCADARVSWAFDVPAITGEADGYYNLTVTRQVSPHMNVTGVYAFAAGNVTLEDDGSVSTQHYVGEEAFAIRNVSAVDTGRNATERYYLW